MNILINFSTLKAGGGQNVALNFVSCILSRPKMADNTLFFSVVKNSKLHKALENTVYKDRLILCRPNPVRRILDEIFISPIYLKRKKIDIIYSYFGWGLFPGKYPQVIGSADSNLYFPDINFWQNYHGLARFKKYIIDRFRIWGLKRANGIVFETNLLESRFHELFDFGAVTKTIKPSISGIEKKDKSIDIKAHGKKCGLFLCGWQLNKNILIIPEVAFELKYRNIDFVFIITTSEDNSQECQFFLEKVRQLDVLDYVNIIGPVDKTQLYSLYEQIDIVFLLSKLESFSNNIIEAWTFKRLLVVADEPWSRDICKNGAIYVNRNSVIQIADIIESYLSGNKYDEIVHCGTIVGATYPSIEQRTRQELSFIKEVYDTSN